MVSYECTGCGLNFDTSSLTEQNMRTHDTQIHNYMSTGTTHIWHHRSVNRPMYDKHQGSKDELLNTMSL